MVRVAIIDDGIGIGLYDIGNVAQSIEITLDITVQDTDKYEQFNNSHGTVCAAIVKKYYSEAIFTSVKVLSDKRKGKKEQLVKAIQWCMDNGIQVANLSLGTIDYRDFELIKDVINKAYNKGLIIVAACSNKDIFTYPAACNNVIGVKCSHTSDLREGEYIFNLYPLDGIEVTACSEHMLLKNGNESKLTRMCNSYAAPMITADVCKIIYKYPNITLEGIKQKLYKSSINYLDNTVRVNNYKNIDWISNAGILNMSEYTSFELPYRNEIKIFKEIENAHLNLFDTVVLLNNSPKDSRNIKSITSKLENEQKNIIVIDDECQDKNYEVEYSNDNIKFWHPSIINHFFEGSLPKKQREVPLIIIYDYTKSNLLKIVGTLTSNFRSDGYYAIGACTKSIGALYGLEYIPLNKDEYIKEIKDKIEALYKVYEYDILILGISINKEDTNIIKKINMDLDSDKTVFCIDDFTHEIKTCIEKMSINDALIITSQNDMDLLYKQILNMFLCENDRS